MGRTTPPLRRPVSLASAQMTDEDPKPQNRPVKLAVPRRPLTAGPDVAAFEAGVQQYD